MENGSAIATLGTLAQIARMDVLRLLVRRERPPTVSPLGVKLCRPSEAVLDLRPGDQLGAMAKEDAGQVVDASGQRVA